MHRRDVDKSRVDLAAHCQAEDGSIEGEGEEEDE